MSTFGTYADRAFQIKTEGETITLTFKKGTPTINQGTISWNIPVPGADCSVVADGQIGAYAGIVILLSTSPLTPEHIPVNGTKYLADPTASPDLHIGDRINGALVVGAVYEAEKVSNDQELTTSIVVSDLKSDIPYYVAGYAVDAQFRYHSDGVRAYSDKYAGEGSQSQPSTQTIKLGSSGILPTDGTGLLPEAFYDFDILWDNTYPHRTNEKVFRIRVNGTNAGTYEDLVKELNTQFSKIENPLRSPVPPNTNVLYWNDSEEKLYSFDGSQLNERTNIVISDSDPTSVVPGEYWYNPSTDELSIFDSSPSNWSPVNVIDYGPVDPRAFKCTDYWYDNDDELAYNWNGTTWCQVTAIVSEADPAVRPLDCGSYWYNTDNVTLYKWDDVACNWVETSAIFWHEPPNALSVGTHWFDLENQILFLRISSPEGWEEKNNVIISSTQPTTPSINLYWYNDVTETLKQWDGTTWISIDVLVWGSDPTDITTCELWWNAFDDQLYVWSVLNADWIQVATFYQLDNDPRNSVVLDLSTIWYKPSAGTILRWDGAAWVSVDIVVNPTDPLLYADGDAWYNEATGDWYVWNAASPSGWQLIQPTNVEDDPTTISNGTYWFDTSTQALYTRSGMLWLATPYVESSPLPRKGQRWFNLSDNNLYEWDGYKWCLSVPVIFSYLLNGNLVFSTRETGGGMNLMVLTPGTPGEVGTGFGEFGYQELPGSAFSNQPDFYVSEIPENEFLFTNLLQDAVLSQHVYGADGVSTTPQELEVGVGTDGSPDERRELADSIRHQLGHPVVTVELTKEQLDTAIRLGLEMFRRKSSAAYKRGFFFLDVLPKQQEYLLTNKQIGYNKIVYVSAIHRFTSAFLSTAHGSGIYGQVVLQHLYNMGTYDLTSYHLISQYIEQLEHLFATRLTFHWDNPSRKLSFYTSFVRRERVLMDCSIERTEQDLLKDRISKNWIRGWALAEAMLMLAQIRGKFGSLPGAGGGITLNAAELQAQATELKTSLEAELDDYIAQDVEDYGLATTFIIG